MLLLCCNNISIISVQCLCNVLSIAVPGAPVGGAPLSWAGLAAPSRYCYVLWFRRHHELSFYYQY